MPENPTFSDLKRKMISDNDSEFGEEARARYGDAEVERSNSRLLGMSQEQFEAMAQLNKEFTETLREARAAGGPGSALAQKAAGLHQRWLCFFWPEYSKAAHAALARMYVDDARFRATYDREGPGTAEFLRDAILIYTSAETTQREG